MKKLLSLIVLATLTTFSANAIDIKMVRMAGPFRVMQPMIIDSLDASQKKYSADDVINTPLSLDMVKEGLVTNLEGDNARAAGPVAKAATNANESQLMLAAFSFTTNGYTKASIDVKGPRLYKVFVNGKPFNNKEGLQPGQYDAVIKYVADTTDIKISLTADNEKVLFVNEIDENPATAKKHPFTLSDNMLMKHYSGIRVSPSGKYALQSVSCFDTDGRTQYKTSIIEAQTGKLIRNIDGWATWMPHTDRYYLKRKVEGKTQLISIDPITSQEYIINDNMPEGSIQISPTEDFAIISTQVTGAKKEDGVYEIINPDDRQPGWRNRSNLSKMDFKTGLVQPLTFGEHSLWLNEISEDGSFIIFSIQEQDLTKRPTTMTTVYRMNLETLESEKLIDKDGFINDLSLVPGTSKLAVTGSAEAFNGIGRNLPDDMTPNIYEHQMFLFDMNSKKVEAVTRDFNPSIESVMPKKDGFIYFTAENADSVSLYRLDAKTNKIYAIKQPCEVIQNFDLAENGNTLLYYGSGACTADRLYSLNTKTLKVAEIGNINADRMANIEIGTCEGWRFKSQNGYEITGHAYLPANYDASKKYPMIVHYYGGCSPTSRRFGGGSHYPAHYWNALGYVVLIVNPSGASGFGQEWGARHVNTAGEGVAEDIIEATKWYTSNHSFVDSEKIGCVSASYGGFMTQLLLTKTDIFACGISHAGISDHTSYWGEGYWGYSYSEVSMANSYPWTRKDLYVDRSPLYNADKIHKPILFTHGTADTNVPIGESIQMYTALKLLGVPTAMIFVEGENHGIMDYHKRQKWINSMVAWFDRYLKGDSSWWNAIYTPKEM